MVVASPPLTSARCLSGFLKLALLAFPVILQAGETCGPGGDGELESRWSVVVGEVETDGECNLSCPANDFGYVGDSFTRLPYSLKYRMTLDRSDLSLGLDDRIVIFRIDEFGWPIIDVYLEGASLGRVKMGATYRSDAGEGPVSGLVDVPSESSNLVVLWQGSFNSRPGNAKVKVTLDGQSVIDASGLDMYNVEPKAVLQGVIETVGSPEGTHRFRPVNYTWQNFPPERNLVRPGGFRP